MRFDCGVRCNLQVGFFGVEEGLEEDHIIGIDTEACLCPVKQLRCAIREAPVKVASGEGQLLLEALWMQRPPLAAVETPLE